MISSKHVHDHSSYFSCRHPNCRAKRLISASVDDLRSSLTHYGEQDLDTLRAALVMAGNRQAKTMAKLLESKINQLSN